MDLVVRLMWEYGYEATSLKMLTSALEVSPPSLYAAFGDKQKLFALALDRYCRTYGSFVEDTLHDASSAADAATSLLSRAPSMYLRPDLPRGCFVELAAEGTRNQTVTEACTNVRSRRRRELADRIRTDQALGRLPAGLDAEALSAYTLGCLGMLARRAAEGGTLKELSGMARIALRAWPRSQNGTGVKP